MSLTSGYLTSKQSQIWELSANGVAEASIARKLNITRQTVHKALDTANTKINESLRETAKLNKIKIEKIDPAKGYLTGYSPHFQTKTLVTYSAKNGVQIWYRHEGDCQHCEQLQTCKETLLAEARDRNIPTPTNSETVLPSQFAKTLFSTITGETE
jgi:hypothetical protein